MIKVTVELWPFGDKEKSRVLGEAKIWNDGVGTPYLGSYGYEVKGKPGSSGKELSGPLLRSGSLGKYRRSDFGVWWLIAAVLRSAYPDVEDSFQGCEIKHEGVVTR